MLLLTEKVEVKCNPNNKIYLESKNYKWEYNKIIEVKAVDLSSGSATKIEVLCDYCCKNIIKMTYKEYLRRNSKKTLSVAYIDKDYCNECKKQIEYNHIKEQFSLKGYKLIEDFFISAKTPMNYICNKHPNNIQKINYNNLKSGQGCYYCGREKIYDCKRFSYEFIKSEFEKKDYILLSKNYKNQDEKLSYICNKHKEFGIQYIAFKHLYNSGSICKCCSKENISGEKSALWKGGKSIISDHLRSIIIQWKLDSMKASNYKCIITREDFDEIHHLYSFNSIVEEAFNILNINVCDTYLKLTTDELIKLEQEVLKLHYKYPLGICLKKDIHDLFHKIYGKEINTPEQFEEFKQRYINGEFK